MQLAAWRRTPPPSVVRIREAHDETSTDHVRTRSPPSALAVHDDAPAHVEPRRIRLHTRYRRWCRWTPLVAACDAAVDQGLDQPPETILAGRQTNSVGLDSAIGE